MKWWLTLVRYAVPQFRSLMAIVVLMLVEVGLGLLAPWPLKFIVDYVLTGKELPARVAWIEALPGANSPNVLIAWLAGGTVGIFLLLRLAAITQNYIQAGVGGRMVYDLARDLFDYLQRSSLLFHETQRKGDLVRRVTADTSCVRQLVMQVYLPLLTSIVAIILTFTVMWQLNRALAIFAVVMVIPLAFIIRVFSGPMSDRKYREWELQGKIASLAEQTLTAIPVVQAFAREECEDRRFKFLAQATVKASLHSEFAQHQFQLSTGTVTAIARMVVLIVGGMAVLHGGLSVGSLLVLVTYFTALYSPIETLAYLSEGFASASAGARRVFEILESDNGKLVDRPDARVLPASCPGVQVRFEEVTFGYRPDRAVLHEISLQANPGEVVALVGPTGAGKSTVVSLIPRFFDAWRGAVYFDDTDIRDITLASLRQQIAVVAQQPFLLPLTIAENIAYGRPDAKRDQIVAAAVAASADAFIQKLPHGYDTVIGERGVTLSGGEQQRLSIARAFLKDASLLILDEPTSALDALTEKVLMEALEHLMKGRTTFIIAHRLSTIRQADQILFIEEGRCVEQGTHAELLRSGGRYTGFHDLQLSKAADTKNALPIQAVS